MTALAGYATRNLVSRLLAPVLIGSIGLGSMPTVAAAPADRTISKSRGTSQAPATCRPKWPYLILTCVA